VEEAPVVAKGPKEGSAALEAVWGQPVVA
jgi:hypothetical protein